MGAWGRVVLDALGPPLVDEALVQVCCSFHCHSRMKITHCSLCPSIYPDGKLDADRELPGSENLFAVKDLLASLVRVAEGDRLADPLALLERCVPKHTLADPPLCQYTLTQGFFSGGSFSAQSSSTSVSVRSLRSCRARSSCAV